MTTVTTDERWARLYRKVFPPVYRAVAATLLDAEAAQDAMHDAFLEGLRHPPTDERNLAGWLYRVALRNGRDQLPLLRGHRRSSSGETEEAALASRSLRVDRDGWPGDFNRGGRWSAPALVYSLSKSRNRGIPVSESGGVIKSPLLYR